ncbi:dihydroorotase [Arenimonas maotaiensis]|uniref:Dihydroorotase n=1 Tax=Arenimonas maotaiensis TaxID=1446479 RepID=A0A917CRS0_9GAMM|nr:dihydroorotase [Arenimonas maotaiensis]GGF96493.1 dihydroorotase [Arenimonas maotaiensis]
MTDTLTLIRPDDWHIHFRDGAAMHSVLPDTARVFARAIAMPNLKPPVLTLADAQAYRDRLLQAARGTAFQPLMTLYLTDNTRPEDIRAAQASGVVQAVKYYPAGATTNSDSGVTDIAKAAKAIAALEECGMPLLLHGEVTDAEVDIFDREAVFIERHLVPLLRDFPNLKIVLEHITTRQAAEFVAAAPANVAATITAHHLLYNRNAIFQGGIRPHMYCLPVLKREPHRLALVAAATGGSPKFFLGTDSAPHALGAKESACGCAGIYTAHAAIELYAEAFEDAGALDRLESFASLHGPDFYGLPRNTDTITLKREAWTVPQTLPLGEESLSPLKAGESLRWKVV